MNSEQTIRGVITRALEAKNTLGREDVDDLVRQLVTALAPSAETALVGQRFGRFLVQSFAGRDAHHNALWNCVCDCGNERVVRGDALKRGRTRSCGCLNAETVKLPRKNK